MPPRKEWALGPRAWILLCAEILTDGLWHFKPFQPLRRLSRPIPDAAQPKARRSAQARAVACWGGAGGNGRRPALRAPASYRDQRE